MPFLGDDQVRRVKESVDIVQLMSEYTPLRKSGGNFAGCCAFHQERTPSMYVYPDQGTYHCFGCGVHGDAITLVREKERLEFTEAVELLAKRAGIHLQYRDEGRTQRARGEREELLQAVETAARFYERMLWESPGAAEARAYLSSRRLTAEVCRRFRLGWSPGSGQLVDEARRRGVDPQLLLRTDLAVERHGRITDRFFERVMFPICDRFGHPLAFSGRLLPAAERRAKEEGRGVGKYINNTDTPLYQKSATVFNLHRARTTGRDRDRLIVMEGPTDVMAADQAGFGECVAVLGTALTPEHARQLGNLVGAQGTLYILLDGDRAGQANSQKAVRTCLSVGVPVRIATLPDELDPAELLAESDRLEEGKATFERVLAAARGDVDHLLRSLAPRPYELDNRQLVAVADQLLDALRPMPDGELRALHLRDAAAYLNIERSRLERRLGSGSSVATATTADTDQAASAPTLPALTADQDLILHILVRCPDLRDAASNDLHLEPSHFPAPWSDLAALVLFSPDADLHALTACASRVEHPAARDAVLRWGTFDLADRVPAVGEPGARLADEALKLRLAGIGQRLHQLGLEIDQAERTRDFAALGALNAERFRLRREQGDLSGRCPSPTRVDHLAR